MKHIDVDVNVRDTIGRTQLHLAATEGVHQQVTMLLAAGADPNAKTDEGATPLHLAERRDDAIETIKVLLAAGADPIE